MNLLAEPTRPDWKHEATERLDLVLLDHAHCEKKAASMAVNFLFRHADQPHLMGPLSRLAREELAHFEQVMQHLRRLEIPFGRLHPSPYAARLMQHARRKGRDKDLDAFLCCALIEARSHERMVILAEAVEDPLLARFYDGLLASEARHLASYVGFAESLFPADEVRDRLTELSTREADAIREPGPEPRMHS